MQLWRTAFERSLFKTLRCFGTADLSYRSAACRASRRFLLMGGNLWAGCVHSCSAHPILFGGCH